MISMVGFKPLIMVVVYVGKSERLAGSVCQVVMVLPSMYKKRDSDVPSSTVLDHLTMTHPCFDCNSKASVCFDGVGKAREEGRSAAASPIVVTKEDFLCQTFYYCTILESCCFHGGGGGTHESTHGEPA